MASIGGETKKIWAVQLRQEMFERGYEEVCKTMQGVGEVNREVLFPQYKKQGSPDEMTRQQV